MTKMKKIFIDQLVHLSAFQAPPQSQQLWQSCPIGFGPVWRCRRMQSSLAAHESVSTSCAMLSLSSAGLCQEYQLLLGWKQAAEENGGEREKREKEREEGRDKPKERERER